jgi:hypothetical protein
MEQQLINMFMKFTSRIGAGEWIKNLIQEVDENGNPKAWTTSEIEKAISYLETATEAFGRQEAIDLIHTILRKYEIPISEIETSHHLREVTRVQGLQ